MSFTKFGVFFSSVLLLGLASGAAWANDKIVSALNIPPGQPAPIIQDNGAASWPTNRNSAPSTLYEGAKWNSASAITWSLANSPGTTDLPFSGYMGSQYEALVQQAFETWAAASGLTFEKVADSSESDIRLGWGEFNRPQPEWWGIPCARHNQGGFFPASSSGLRIPYKIPSSREQSARSPIQVPMRFFIRSSCMRLATHWVWQTTTIPIPSCITKPRGRTTHSPGMMWRESGSCTARRLRLGHFRLRHQRRRERRWTPRYTR